MKRSEYEQILDRDVPVIVNMSKNLARQGISASIAVYYRTREIAGESTAMVSTLPDDGWKHANVEIPCNVPYDRYWNYLYQRMGNVPLFA